MSRREARSSRRRHMPLWSYSVSVSARRRRAAARLSQQGPRWFQVDYRQRRLPNSCRRSEEPLNDVLRPGSPTENVRGAGFPSGHGRRFVAYDAVWGVRAALVWSPGSGRCGFRGCRACQELGAEQAGAGFQTCMGGRGARVAPPSEPLVGGAVADSRRGGSTRAESPAHSRRVHRPCPGDRAGGVQRAAQAVRRSGRCRGRTAESGRAEAPPGRRRASRLVLRRRGRGAARTEEAVRRAVSGGSGLPGTRSRL